MKDSQLEQAPENSENPAAENSLTEEAPAKKAEKAEFGGPKGLEPTRFGDWEKAGRCIDF